jgi:predicted kinase
MTQELILCRGIPACGKSTWAQAWVLVRPDRVRISRDDIRFDLFGRYYDVDEKLVTDIEDAMVRTALTKGKSVVVDDCNVDPKYIYRLADIAHNLGIPVSIQQFDVDLKTAKQRNAARARVVPENVLDKFYGLLQKYPHVDVSKPEVNVYVPPANGIPAILVDIDGTIAHNGGKRGFYDWMKVSLDEPKLKILRLVDMYYAAGYAIVVMSGRDAVCRELTLRWLFDNGVAYEQVFMRPENDQRKDSIVKLELFDKHVRDVYDVEVVLDDRDQVVNMWRSLGLTCLQVAPGDF